MIIFIISALVFSATLGIILSYIIVSTFENNTKRDIKYKPLLVTIVALIIGFGLSGLISIDYKFTQDIYNKGIHRDCGQWELFDIEKAKGCSIYYYKCNQCGELLQSDYILE